MIREAAPAPRMALILAGFWRYACSSTAIMIAPAQILRLTPKLAASAPEPRALRLPAPAKPRNHLVGPDIGCSRPERFWVISHPTPEASITKAMITPGSKALVAALGSTMTAFAWLFASLRASRLARSTNMATTTNQ